MANMSGKNANGDTIFVKARGLGTDPNPFILGGADSSTVARVASSTSPVTLLAANTARAGAIFYNDSTAVLYLKLGSGAGATSKTLPVAAGGYYEVPFGYTGIITGVWAAANGACDVTEVY